MSVLAFNPLERLSEGWNVSQLFQFEPPSQDFLIILGVRLAGLLICIILAILVSRVTPSILLWFTARSLPEEKYKEYKNFTDPFHDAFVRTLTLILIDFSLNFLNVYEQFYNIINFVADFAVMVSSAWLVSRVAKQAIRIYGVSLLKRVSQEVNDLILIFENTVNVIIGFLAVLIFAQSKDFNLIALLTGLGIGGIAIAFAAQEALSQILATIVIYLDRPYLPGEYVRINFVVTQEDVYGRIESIGLRSTKLRISVTNTLLVVPNSLMVTKDIENISRGTKVMVLFYLDFDEVLEESERALVDKTVQESVKKELFGLDPGSTQVALFEPEDKPGTRARVSLFVMGSNEESMMIRKRLVEIANKSISDQLQKEGLKFQFAEPTIYVDSPVTL
ncbi:MscS Mechanosensitive ion channel [Halothece sp. PCC 7418]|uniref:mechanosensitive ion channel family protein n=1 Tax=Halothece sp. (strain PCC 7418) TaxID=65093 RepID=UPI0002A076E7|nr:mechanosensitive ion channel domain-containing protein [Halothece sp. PCC 7418]AFZ45778.1 MscS Mechanosensitive ion channel [Halothece sp. PCC 7418]